MWLLLQLALMILIYPPRNLAAFLIFYTRKDHEEEEKYLPISDILK